MLIHYRFPKTYPALACPTFTIQRPIVGLKPHEVTKLSNAIHAEAQKNKGSEIVFQVRPVRPQYVLTQTFMPMIQIVTFAQDWILNHVVPPLEVVGSLATEMKKRAIAEEEVRSPLLLWLLY